jgi:hypothetical protein
MVDHQFITMMLLGAPSLKHLRFVSKTQHCPSTDNIVSWVITGNFAPRCEDLPLLSWLLVVVSCVEGADVDGFLDFWHLLTTEMANVSK